MTPRGVFDPKTPLFGWKMAFWAYIFETSHQILMIFSQMLDIIALNDLAALLCTKKFLYPPGGAFLPQKMLKNPPYDSDFFKSCQILLKICTLSNLMVLNSFLMFFWPPKKLWPLPRGGLTQKPPFLAEKWPFEPISLKPRIRFWWFFHRCYILLLLMIWRHCYVLKNSSSSLGGGFFAPKNVKKSPPVIVIF